MKRNVAAFAALLAVSISFTACGGDSGLDKDELIAQGDKICETGKQDLQQKAATAFEGDPSTAELTAFIKDELVPLYRNEIRDLKALEPDGDSEQAWNDMIAKLEKGVNEFAADPAAVIKGGTSPLEEANRAALDFGMKVCGSGE
ncbi:MAG: hypothetical protein M9938_06375 [Solirubrobacterales bacterium]|nr:hypothetical protein [Solirubrobacterales bacterium]